MSTTKTLAPTSPVTRSTREKHKEFLFPATIQYYAEPIVFTEGKGLRIRDADGNEYLDFFGGILTVSVGHANDKVNAAIKAQVDRFSHVSSLYPMLPVVELAERLARPADADRRHQARGVPLLLPLPAPPDLPLLRHRLRQRHRGADPHDDDG